MAKVNTGNRTPAQDAEATETLKAQVAAEGADVIEENGGFWAVTQAHGLTIKTRIG